MESGGLFIPDHQIIDHNSKTALPAPPNWVTFCLYLHVLNTFWHNFNEIDSPGGVAAVVFQNETSSKIELTNSFASLQNHPNAEGVEGCINLCQKRCFHA